MTEHVDYEPERMCHVAQQEFSAHAGDIPVTSQQGQSLDHG
jgi:hypothetical protein